MQSINGFRDLLCRCRGGTKSLIFHVTCVHTNACHHGCPSYSHCVEAKTSRDPQGIPSLNSVVLIADHGHIHSVPGILRDHPQKSPLKFCYNIIGIKSDDTAFWGGGGGGGST